MIIKCEHKGLRPLISLIEHPRNTRKHPKEQIEYIARLYQYTGIRHPIIVSERSGFIVAGHARKKAAELLGMESFPVDIQEFESEAEEYAFLEADNNIAELAEHDRAKMLENVRELGPDIDIEMLGLPDLDLGEIDGGEFEGKEDDQGKLDEKAPKFCPHCNGLL